MPILQDKYENASLYYGAKHNDPDYYAIRVNGALEIAGDPQFIADNVQTIYAEWVEEYNQYTSSFVNYYSLSYKILAIQPEGLEKITEEELKLFRLNRPVQSIELQIGRPEYGTDSVEVHELISTGRIAELNEQHSQGIVELINISHYGLFTVLDLSFPQDFHVLYDELIRLYNSYNKPIIDIRYNANKPISV